KARLESQIALHDAPKFTVTTEQIAQNGEEITIAVKIDNETEWSRDLLDKVLPKLLQSLRDMQIIDRDWEADLKNLEKRIGYMTRIQELLAPIRRDAARLQSASTAEVSLDDTKAVFQDT